MYTELTKVIFILWLGRHGCWRHFYLTDWLGGHSLLRTFVWVTIVFVDIACWWRVRVTSVLVDLVCWGQLCGLLLSWWTWVVEDMFVGYYCLGGHGLLRTCVWVTSVLVDMVCWGHLCQLVLSWWTWFVVDIDFYFVWVSATVFDRHGLVKMSALFSHWLGGHGSLNMFVLVDIVCWRSLCLVTGSVDMICWGHLSLNYCLGGHGLLRTFVVEFRTWWTWFVEDACLWVTAPKDLVCWGHFVFELLNWLDMVCWGHLCQLLLSLWTWS